MCQLRALLMGVLLTVFSSMFGQSFTGVGGTITDNNTWNYYPVSVSGVGNLNGTNAVLQVCVSINHGDLGDLDIELRSPNGTIRRLAQRELVGTIATNLCFEAGGADLSTGTAPYDEGFSPNQTLGGFSDGQNANGTWDLRIRDRYTGDAGSLVSWSINFGTPPPSEQDCAGAIPVCTDLYYNANSYVGTGNVLNEINPGPSCLNSGEKNDVWYVFRVQTSGALNFTIIPNNGNDDYDWAVYDLTNNDCEDIYNNAALEVACDYSGSTSNGGRTGANGGGNAQDEPTVNVTAGRTFVLNVSNYSSTQNGYTLDFGASTAQVFDDVPPAFTGVTSAIACGGTEVEFEFDENVLCSSVEIADFELVAPSGAVHTVTNIAGACDGGANYGRSFTATVTPAITESGVHTFNLLTTSGSVEDNCGNVAPASSFTFSVNGITATITSSDISCVGASDGTLSTVVTSGTAPFSYLWDANAGSQMSANVSGLEAGDYTVVVTDATGCSTTVQGSVGVGNSGLLADFTVLGNSCFEEQSFQFQNTGSTGAGISYLWDFGNGDTSVLENPSFSGFTSIGLHPVTFTISDGTCSEVVSKNVEVFEKPTVSVSATDPLCFGEASGEADATASNGVGPYTYLWSNGSTASSAGGLSSGEIWVTVSDANGCTVSDSSVLSDPAALSLVLSSSPVTCNAGTDGGVDAFVNGGTIPYVYVWSNSAITEDITGVSAGNYALSVTDVNGCSVAESVDVLEPTAVSVSETIEEIECNGDNSGVVSVVASGGTPDYTFSWSNGATGGSVASLPAGVIDLTVSDANNCVSNYSYTISQPEVLSVGYTKSDISCNGGTDGAIDLTVVGGVPPYNYLWNHDGSTTNSIAGLSAGTYSAQIWDANGCVSNVTVTLTEPTALLVDLSATDVSCFNGADGSATSIVSGGSGTYSYVWNSGSTSTSSDGLIAGYESVVVSDGNGCLVADSIYIDQPQALNLLEEISPVSCFEGSNGSIQITANGGTGVYVFAWNNGVTTATNANLMAGDYTVQVVDENGCQISGDYTVSQPGELIIQAGLEDVSCYGGSTGVIDLSVEGGNGVYSYTWSTGALSPELSGLEVGTYNVTVEDANGCLVKESYEITGPEVLDIELNTSDVLCYGASTGSAEVQVVGGVAPYSIYWSNAMNGNVNNGLAVGSYSVTVTDANNCVAQTNFTINTPLALEVTILEQMPNCFGETSGVLTAEVEGGVSPYVYQWSNGVTTSSNANVSSGAYSLTVTDGNGCSELITGNLNEPSAINVDAQVLDGTCNLENGSVTLNITGGTGVKNVLWSSGESTTYVLNKGLGSFGYFIEDQNGCLFDGVVDVGNSGTPVISNLELTSPLCNGGSDGAGAVEIAGGIAPYTTQWSNAEVGVSTNSLNAGFHSVSIIDQAGCRIDSAFTVVEPTAVHFDLIEQVAVSCNGGTDGRFEVEGTGGVAPYHISSADGFENLAAGSHEFQVVDANGCIYNGSIELDEPSALALTLAVDQPLCYGAESGEIQASTTGGNGDYGYTWGDGSTGEIVSNLGQGSYAVTVVDALGCATQATASVIYPEELGMTIQSEKATCLQANGSVSLEGVGGTGSYVYRIDGVSFSGASNTLGNGGYLFEVEDANGCTYSQNIMIQDDGLPQFENIDLSPTHCGQSLGEMNVGTPQGNGPFELFVNGVIQNDWAIAALGSGNYPVQIQDVNGCINDTIITIEDKAGVQAVISSYSDPLYFEATNGFALAEGIGGEMPYEFLWNDGQQTAQASGLSAGTAVVLVTDANNCVSQAQVVLVDPAPITLNSSNIQAVLCAGGATGAISVEVEGGVAPYNYAWSSGQITKDIDGLSAGNYQLTVCDAVGGCFSFDFEVTQPEVFELTLVQANDPTCFEGSNGFLEVAGSGGAFPYDFNWSNGSITALANNLIAGDYHVVATDRYGCTSELSANLGQPAAVMGTAEVQNAHCGKADGAASVLAEGGTGTKTIVWSKGATSFDIEGLAIGIHTYTLEDEQGCTFNGTVEVLDQDPGFLKVAVDQNVQCYGAQNGQVSCEVLDGFGGYLFSLNDSIQNTEGVFDNVDAGSHLMQVEDTYGCELVAYFTVTQPSPIDIHLNTADDTTICYGNSVLLSADIQGGTGVYTLNWGVDTVGNEVWVSPSVSSKYVLQVTDTNNCTGFADEVNINVLEPLQAGIFADDLMVCPSGTTQITAKGNGGTGTYTFEWLDNTGITSDARSVTLSETQEFGVVVSDGCSVPSDTAYVTIGVFEKPDMELRSSANEGCEGIVIQLDHLIIPDPYEVDWTVVGPDTTITGVDALEFEYRSAGNYDVTMNVVTEDGCLDSLNVPDFITIYPVPTAEFIYNPGDPSYLNNNLSFLDRSSTPFGTIVNWDWEITNDQYSLYSREQEPVFEMPDSGWYNANLTVTNDYGCTDTFNTEIRVDDSYYFYIPNAFTPQEDGLNDAFGPITRGIELEQYEFTIWDRWGEMVYQTYSPQEWWDGTYFNGNVVQSDAYVWQASFRKSTDGKMIKLYGTVTVLR